MTVLHSETLTGRFEKCEPVGLRLGGEQALTARHKYQPCAFSLRPPHTHPALQGPGHLRLQDAGLPQQCSATRIRLDPHVRGGQGLVASH